MQCTFTKTGLKEQAYAILAVDDLPANLSLLKGTLGKHYRLDAVGSGQEAIAALDQAEYDLILLDIMMPGLDGFETLERLHALPNFGNTPVIFLTASHDEHLQHTGLALGAADYITKPFVIDHVRLRIANVLQRARLQKQLELALNSADLGLWEFDVCQDRILLDPKRGVLLDVPVAPDGFNGPQWGEIAHPDCLPQLQEAIAAVLTGSASVIDLDIRMKTRSGHWVWANIYGKACTRGSCGQITRLMGTYRNIHQRKLAEEAKRDSEERLQLVMEATGEGVWDWDIASARVTHNTSWCRILGLEEDYLEHDVDFFKSLIHPDDVGNVEQALSKSLQEGVPYQSEHRLRRADGNYTWVQDRGQIVRRAGDGQPTRMVGSIKDIDAQKRAEAEIHQLAYYDMLTGLPNRRLLIDRMNQSIKANTRNRSHSALMFIDMDRFKEINDTLGHDAGDRLLVDVGTRLRAAVRDCDTVARLGGDEFVVMLNSLGGDYLVACSNSLLVGQKIMDSLNEAYQFGQTLFHSTPSIGLTVFSGMPHSVDEVLKLADDAMYKAKANGRNCLRMTLDKSDLGQAGCLH